MSKRTKPTDSRPVLIDLPSMGDGKRRLEIQVLHGMMRVTDKTITGKPEVAVDWFCDRLQFLAFDGVCDEPAAQVQLNEDGTVSAILVRAELMSKVRRVD